MKLAICSIIFFIAGCANNEPAKTPDITVVEFRHDLADATPHGETMGEQISRTVPYDSYGPEASPNFHVDIDMGMYKHPGEDLNVTCPKDRKLRERVAPIWKRIHEDRDRKISEVAHRCERLGGDLHGRRRLAVFDERNHYLHDVGDKRYAADNPATTHIGIYEPILSVKPHWVCPKNTPDDIVEFAKTPGGMEPGTLEGLYGDLIERNDLCRSVDLNTKN